ncbi:hypothetical protein EDB86DRAFT_3197855 [Lactarius hatsudake]|nr:hypothetical protein EDB86DRAFT_3197855 [Lactarius hatsudake]
MSDPAPVSQPPSSTPQGDYAHTELLRNRAQTRLQLPPNDLPGVPRLYYTNVSLEDATAEFLDVADSSFDPPSGHQDHTEGVNLPASCSLRFGSTFDGRDPSPTEGSAFLSASRYFEGTLFPSASILQPPPSLHQNIELDRARFSQTLPQTFSAETDVTRDTSRVLVPPTPPLSSARSYFGESGDNETFSSSMAICVSTWGSGTATTPLAVHLPDSTLNDYIPLHPYEAAPSFGHQDTHQTSITLLAPETAIDGLIVLDSANTRPIVQTSFRSFPPACPLLHINAYSSAVTKAVRPEDVDPVLLVALPDEPTAYCHLQHRSLTFLCPISGDLVPLYSFTFIRTFLNILIEHPHRILRRNAGGHLLTTAPNETSFSLPLSLISKILSVTGVAGPSGPSTNNLSAFSSSIPWRKAGLRYNHNDIYSDVVETLDAVVNKNGTIITITSSVLRKVDVNCKLSGAAFLVPMSLLVLDLPVLPCPVRTTWSISSSAPTDKRSPPLPNRPNRFAQSKALSFVPPDGRFTLMEYRFDPSASEPGAAPALTAAAAAQFLVQVPFTLHASLSIDHGGAFELSFTPRAGALEDVAVTRLRCDGRDVQRRKRWRRVDVRARAAHAALVPYPLRHSRCHPFRLRAGPERDAAGHVRERGCTPAPRARGADIVQRCLRARCLAR